ncbi:MAG: hypothetical protein E1N59_1014 [Puniceicoccaceae bacterium 5H]|nr:MAG: hypothetical protein E1N59_1014 [Puniceicoccaceae bacterium 5H]
MKTLIKSFATISSLALLASSAFAEPDREDMKSAMEDTRDAARVINQMQRIDPDLAQTLEHAKGVLVIPDYVTAALIAGGSGGEGVLLENDNGEWSNPVFYDLGEGSIGLQAGVSAGSMVFILNSQEAVDTFKDDNNFALNAEAGLSIVNWSERGHGEAGRADDVIAWTDTEGLFGEASIGISDITWDDEENAAFYGQQVSAREILSGDVKNPHNNPLRQAIGS